MPSDRRPRLAVDVHTHNIPPNFVDALKGGVPGVGAHIEDRAEGPVVVHDEGYVYPLHEAFHSVSEKRADMDRRGIDVSVLSPAPTFLLYERDPGLAAEMIQVMNDGSRDMVAREERLHAMALLPMQDPARAEAELERVLAAHGMKGVEVGSHIAGVPLGDVRYRNLWKRVAEAGLMVFVHPYYTGTKTGMERYYLTNLVGNPLDTMLAIADAVFSGLLEDVPDLKLLFAHGGGFAPYQIGRLRHGYEVRTEPRVAAKKPPDALFEDLYFDTITHDARALAYLIGRVGAEHVLLGTDLPFDMADGDPLRTIASSGVEGEAMESVAGQNAVRHML